MRIFDLVQFYLLLLRTYLRDMKAYCLTTGHWIVCHCCCILSCYALCFLILLALFFWLLPLHFGRFKKIIFLFCLSIFFHFFFHFLFAFFSLLFRFFFAFFSLFFRFSFPFFSLFFRFFPRENAIFDFQQKPEKLPKNEVKKKAKKKRKKSEQKAKKKAKKMRKQKRRYSPNLHRLFFWGFLPSLLWIRVLYSPFLVLHVSSWLLFWCSVSNLHIAMPYIKDK